MNGEFDPFIFEAALAKRAPGAPEQQWRSFRLGGAAHPNRGTPAATSGLVFALPPAAFAFFFPLFFFGILSRTEASALLHEPGALRSAKMMRTQPSCRIAFFSGLRCRYKSSVSMCDLGRT